MAVTPKLARAEIWDDFEAAGGSVASLNPGAILQDLSSFVRTEEVNGDHRARIQVPRHSTSWQSGGLAKRRVVRAIYDDGSTVEEYRIVGTREQRQQSGMLVGVVEAEGPLFELTGTSLITRTEDSGLVQPDFELMSQTATELLTSYVLPAAPAWFSIGTIETTQELTSFGFDFDTPLSALREIAELTQTELQVRRDGSSGYFIDLLQTVGSGADKPFVYLGKNITRFEKHTDAKKLANRIYGKGAGDIGNRLTLGGNAWTVSAVGGSTLTLDGDPVWEDDAVNGLYLGREDGTDIQEVTDSTAPGTVTVASPGTYSTGDRLRFYQDATGTEVAYVEDASKQSSDGVIPRTLDAEDLQKADNIVPNPKLDEYTSGSPDDWSAVGGSTLAENTDTSFYRVGSGSLHITMSAADEGVESAEITIAPEDANPYYSGAVSIWVVSGNVRFEFVHSTEGTFPEQEDKAWTGTPGQWVDLAIQARQYPAGTVKLRLVADGGAAEVYLDSAMFLNSANMPPFIAENASNELWRRAAIELQIRRSPDITYDVKAPDLNAIDPVKWPDDKFVLGGLARVIEPDIEADTELRVLTLERDIVTGRSQRIVFSSKPPHLTEEALRRRLRERQPPIENDSAQFWFSDAWLNKDGDLIYKYRLKRPTGRSILYKTSTTSQPARADVISSGTAHDGTEDEFTAAAAIAPKFGDGVYITVVAMSGASGGGLEGALVEHHRVNANPPPLTGRLSVDVDSDGNANLKLSLAGPAKFFPVTAVIYQNDPTQSANRIDLTGGGDTDHEFTAAGEEIGYVGSGAGTEYSGLTDIALPLKASYKWYVKLTDTDANEYWSGFSMADRNKKPGGDVILLSFRANPVFRMEYDDDVEEIVFTEPGGKTKTYSGLSGGGVKSYVVGVTALDDATTEDALAVDEVRGDYTIDYKGGGTTKRVFNGEVNGAPSNPPIVKPRFVVSSSKDVADVYGTIESPVGEDVTVRYRNSDDPAATIWKMVVANGDPTVKYVTTGSEVGPSEWFYDGSTYAQKLDDIALLRDQNKIVSLQAKAEDSGVEGAWETVSLPLKEQPWLESMACTFDEGDDKIKIPAVAGAHMASALCELTSVLDGGGDPDYSSGVTLDQAAGQELVDGDKFTWTYSISDSDREKQWHARVTPYNGWTGSAVSGLAGVAQEDAVYVGGGDPIDSGGMWVQVTDSGWEPFKIGHRFRYTVRCGDDVDEVVTKWTRDGVSDPPGFHPESTHSKAVTTTDGKKHAEVYLEEPPTGGTIELFNSGDAPGMFIEVHGQATGGSPRSTSKTITPGPPEHDGSRSPSGPSVRAKSQAGAIKQGDYHTLRPLFDVDDDAGDESRPRLRLRDNHSLGGSLSGTITPDMTNGPVQHGTLGGDATLAVPTNMEDGESMQILLDLSSNALSFATGWKFPGGDPSGLSGEVVVTCTQINGVVYGVAQGSFS